MIIDVIGCRADNDGRSRSVFHTYILFSTDYLAIGQHLYDALSSESGRDTFLFLVFNRGCERIFLHSHFIFHLACVAEGEVDGIGFVGIYPHNDDSIGDGCEGGA